MKRLLISVAVFGLLAGAPAYADNDHHHGQGQGQGRGGGSAGGSGGSNPKHEGVPGSNGIFDRAAGRTGQGSGSQNTLGGPGRWQSNGNNGNWQGNGNRHGNANNWQGGNWQGNANNHWRGNNRWRGNTWHGNSGITITGRNWTAPQRFHFGAYRRPQGWYYRRWGFGDFLPAAFFVNSYWLTNYLAFGLDPPPPGLVWVRYGDDALLVDRYSGEVVQVVYGVFY